MRAASAEPGRFEAAAALAGFPRLAEEDGLDFACAGCGDCCRGRRDLLLNGYDLYRLARRLGLPPRIVAEAFCKAYTGGETLLPTLRLAPRGKKGDCPFLEGGACTVHAARPLACALYPLGQCIDLDAGTVEYFVQTPLCGARPGQRPLSACLRDAGVTDRSGIDVRWAVVCAGLSRQMRQAGGEQAPHYRTAVRRIARALYYDYSLGDEFYPQFCENTRALPELVARILK